MPLHVSSTLAHLQEVKIVLYSLWYHHTYRWPHPDDEHMCSKHVEAWNKLIIKFSASSWLILRYMVDKSAYWRNINAKSTPCSRVILEKLTVVDSVNEVLTFYGTWKLCSLHYSQQHNYSHYLYTDKYLFIYYCTCIITTATGQQPI